MIQHVGSIPRKAENKLPLAEIIIPAGCKAHQKMVVNTETGIPCIATVCECASVCDGCENIKRVNAPSLTVISEIEQQLPRDFGRPEKCMYCREELNGWAGAAWPTIPCLNCKYEQDFVDQKTQEASQLTKEDANCNHLLRTNKYNLPIMSRLINVSKHLQIGATVHVAGKAFSEVAGEPELYERIFVQVGEVLSDGHYKGVVTKDTRFSRYHAINKGDEVKFCWYQVLYASQYVSKY